MFKVHNHVFNMQYYLVYLENADITIAVSLCCGTLINKMAASDETSLISSEVEGMGLGRLQTPKTEGAALDRLSLCIVGLLTSKDIFCKF